MLCPECNHQLLPVTVKTDTGDVSLDYCASCGGIWADQGKANFVKTKDLTPLLALLPQKGIHPPPQNTFCPKDRNILEAYRGNNVPLDINLYHCPKCNGMWFPEHAFREFKAAQEAKINYFKTWKIPLASIYAVLLPVFILISLTGGLYFILFGFNSGTEIRTKAKDVISKPIVLHPSPDQVLISFTTGQPQTVNIAYWITPREVQQAWVSQTPSQTHTILLKDLEPDRTYSYQLIIPGPPEVKSPVYIFSTRVTN
jgi:Zn-finger nucleic acid-binding protein